jgi:hypothetical protein
MTEEEALEMVRRDGWTIKCMPLELKTLRVCVEAVKRNIFMVVYVPEGLVDEVEAAMKEEALEIERQCGWALDYAPEEQRTLELCREVVRQDGWALYYVPEELRERVKAAVENERDMGG